MTARTRRGSAKNSERFQYPDKVYVVLVDFSHLCRAEVLEALDHGEGDFEVFIRGWEDLDVLKILEGRFYSAARFGEGLVRRDDGPER